MVEGVVGTTYLGFRAAMIVWVVLVKVLSKGERGCQRYAVAVVEAIRN